MRGSYKNTPNRYLKHQQEYSFEREEDAQDYEASLKRTNLIALHPKTILNKITSPDVGMDYSLNPYQGCEHGCAYCYARPTHEYWGYNAGIDFEQNILVKHNAPELLRSQFEKRSWKGEAVSLSGNTDCYQPIERKLGITRKLLKVFLEYRNPLGIITKNALILRDLDLLQELAGQHLIHVAITITGLDESLRQKLEPRTASTQKKLEVIRVLSEHGIPVMAMMAPVIPSLNSHDILPLAKAVSEAGARKIGYTMLRLNGPVSEIFSDWLDRHYPDRAQRVMNQVKGVHGGKESDSRFGKRMKGEGNVAEMVKQQFDLARNKYGLNKPLSPFNHKLFCRPGGQISLGI